jgi:hypothetical protein
LWQSSDLLSPFSVLASNILATPPTNTYLDDTGANDLRFYRLQVQP